MINPANPSCPCNLKSADAQTYASAGLPGDPMPTLASMAVQHVIYPREMFWLRPTATFARTGAEYPAGTALGLIGAVDVNNVIQRLGNLTLYYVEAPNGTRGYVALTAADVASRTRDLTTVSRVDQTYPVRGATHDRFWLREVATLAHNAPDGRQYPVFPRGTIVEVIAPTAVSRGSLRVYQVRVPDGRTGFAAFTQRDLSGMRSYASNIVRSPSRDEFDADLSNLGD